MIKMSERCRSVVLARTLRGIWPSLPALAVGSAAICLAGIVPVAIAPGVNPVAVLLVAVAVAPWFAGIVAVTNDIARGECATIVAWWRRTTELWRFAIAHASIAATPVALFLVAAEVLTATGAIWVWPSFAATGATAVVAVLALAAVLPLGAARPELRGGELWIAALAVVARNPTRFVAVVASTAFGVWTATSLSASLLLLVPAPTAIVAVAATWTSLEPVPPARTNRPTRS